jgi:hypothetical protein
VIRTLLVLGASLAVSVVLSSGALPQTAESAPIPTGAAVQESIPGLTLYSADGMTRVVGDGMGGGFIFGPKGSSSFISNNTGGATLYAPDSSDSIITDGRGGLYGSERLRTSPGGDAR